MDVREIFTTVGTWFSQVFSAVFSFYYMIDFLQVIFAFLFIVSVVRFLIIPFVGGAQLRPDKATMSKFSKSNNNSKSGNSINKNNKSGD